MKIHKNLTCSGQSLLEYILVIFTVSIFILSIFQLFGNFMKLIYQQHARSLGYEILNEKNIAKLRKNLLIKQMELEIYKDNLKKIK